ncbi:hypothetical protein [Devosia salina]|uniref:Uncharacterized protein n=1 Tax=Devosia salina TaxID=2860336 RepID=A0ABX8WBP5_9HYPH|nr:hypothetical protein [Devosia salina]QYO75514.1 hypothetical protein K1X15_12800 [Devosia salina]
MALIALLVAQGLVFLVFIIAAFWWLFALRRFAVSRSGSTLPGLRDTLSAFKDGLSNPRYARLRWAILCSAALLVASAALVPILAPA